MPFSQVISGNKRAPYVVQLVVDNDADIATLPSHYAPGSTCLVINTSRRFMLNHLKQWIEVFSSGGGGGGGGEIVVEGSLADKSDIDNLFA